MEKKKTILIFSLAYHPFVGGAEVAIKEIAERLGEGFDFDMITVNLDGRQKQTEENFNGISNIYRLGRGKLSKYLFPWLACKKAIELQKIKNYDLIWAMMANQAGLAALKLKKKFPQVPYLLTLQEGDSELDIWLRTWFIRPIYKAIYRHADYIQAISNFLAKRAKKMGAKCPIEVVPNGVDMGGVMKYLKSHKDFKTSSNKKNRIVVTLSRLVKKNGIQSLIEAMQDVDGKLLIFGSGELDLCLKKITKKLKLNNKIDFKGEINQFFVFEKISEAGVFVRPSLSEGLGNAFLEAMAVGVPVIGTPVGGIPDFLKDGETGWFCEVKNPKSIAAKINYILDEKNKAEVERVVENAKKLVEEKYNWNKISENMKNIFNKLIK